MVRSSSEISESYSVDNSEHIQYKSCNYQKAAIITTLVLEVLLFLGALAFGTVAIFTGLHLLWLGVIPCAMAMIGLIGVLMCTFKPSVRNNRTFQRLQPYIETVAYTSVDRHKGQFAPAVPDWG